MSSQIYPTPLYRPPLPFTAASHATPTPSTSPAFGSSSSSPSTLPMSQFHTPGQYVPYTSSAVPGTLSPMYISATNTPPHSTPPIPASSPSVRSGRKRPHHLHHQVDSAPLKPIDETTDESDVDEDEDDDYQDDNRVGTLPRPNSVGVLHSFRSAPPSDATSSRSRHPKKKRKIVESFAGLSLDPTAASASRSAAGLTAAAQPLTTVMWNESTRVQRDRTPALPQAPITTFGRLPIPSLPTPDVEDLPMGTGPSSFDLDEHRIYVASLDSPPPSPNLSPPTHEFETETEAHTDLTNLTIPTTLLKHLPPPLPLDVIKSLEASDKGAERGAAQALVLYQPLKWTPQEKEQQLEEFRREQAKQERYDDADGVHLDTVEGAEGNGMEID